MIGMNFPLHLSKMMRFGKWDIKLKKSRVQSNQSSWSNQNILKIWNEPDIEVNQGNFVKAAERYKKIIKTSKNLNNVILSLEEAVKNNPGELKLIQTLGDAYVRTGRLQDALDAYTKAEELLK